MQNLTNQPLESIEVDVLEGVPHAFLRGGARTVIILRDDDQPTQQLFVELALSGNISWKITATCLLSMTGRATAENRDLCNFYVKELLSDGEALYKRMRAALDAWKAEQARPVEPLTLSAENQARFDQLENTGDLSDSDVQSVRDELSRLLQKVHDLGFTEAEKAAKARALKYTGHIVDTLEKHHFKKLWAKGPQNINGSAQNVKN